MNKPTEYNITKTDEELKILINKLRPGNDFADFCNIVITRATRCWQSGLEHYPFGEKNYSDRQSVDTVLEMIGLQIGNSAYDANYKFYVKESICMYHKIYERKQKLKRIIK